MTDKIIKDPGFTILPGLLCSIFIFRLVVLWWRDGYSGFCIMNAFKSKDARIFLLVDWLLLRRKKLFQKTLAYFPLYV